LTGLVDLHRNLIARTTNSLAANFDVGLDVFQRGFEDLDWGILARFATSLDFIQRVVEDTLCNRLLAVVHQAVNELAGDHRIVAWIALERRAAGGNASHRVFVSVWKKVCVIVLNRLFLLRTVATAATLAAVYTQRVA
jgi:hypothetical protein